MKDSEIAYYLCKKHKPFAFFKLILTARPFDFELGYQTTGAKAKTLGVREDGIYVARFYEPP